MSVAGTPLQCSLRIRHTISRIFNNNNNFFSSIHVSKLPVKQKRKDTKTYAYTKPSRQRGKNVISMAYCFNSSLLSTSNAAFLAETKHMPHPQRSSEIDKLLQPQTADSALHIIRNRNNTERLQISQILEIFCTCACSVYQALLSSPAPEESLGTRLP